MGDPRKHNLEIRQVEPKHLEQFNELMKYVFQVTSEQIENSGYEDDEEVERAKKPILEKAFVIGWFKNETLASQLAVYPCEVNIHGKIIKMGGLTGVGTYPEYSNLGLMTNLIKFALQKMREAGQLVSYLYPYSIPYYRKKGWEIICDIKKYTIKDDQFPELYDVAGHVERVEVNDAVIIDIYDRFARKNHGAMVRNDLNWEEYWRWENEEEMKACVYYTEDNIPTGFCLYSVEADVFSIKEMIYITQEARKGIWNFISAHESMVDFVKGKDYSSESISFLFDESDIEERIRPFYMGRIVDVKAFLKEYNFQEAGTPIHFIVSDPVAEWNNGIFGLFWDENGDVQVTDEAVGDPIEIDIQTLTTMLFSYKRPGYLYRIERIKADVKTIKMLEKIIRREKPYFSDYF